MKCELCGRDYAALGVHLRRKHAVDPDDYRDDFGILRTTPLVDEDLSARFRAGAVRRLQDEEYRKELQEQIRKVIAANKGAPHPGMSRAGKAALAKRNTEAASNYRRERADKVAEILRDKKTMLDVRRELGMGREAVKKIVAEGYAEYDKVAAKDVATQRRQASRRAKLTDNT